jgi:Zn finger protein HypA/HybF involved in hydrogenase expression/transposase-like protein
MGRRNDRRLAQIAAMLQAGMTGAAIARELEISAPTVCYYARKRGMTSDASVTRRYDWEEVQRYYDSGHSITDCQLHFGMARKTFYDATLRGAIVTRPQATPLHLMLVEGSRHNRVNLKQRMIKAGLKDGRCEDCGLTQWRGQPLSMALHHVNGDGRDNRLENLRLLCPNCHSQTENFAGRGVVRQIKPAA